jgi:outer membrane receptor protein involved in Fe transport
MVCVKPSARVCFAAVGLACSLLLSVGYAEERARAGLGGDAKGLPRAAQPVAAGANEKKVAQAPSKAEPVNPLEITDALEGLEVEKMVVEALKSETTIQEAPAIITVLPGDEIRDQGYRYVYEAIQAVPGFIGNQWEYGVTQTIFPRGLLGGGLPMMDGLDLFASTSGLSHFGRNVPVEMVQRVELMSGPGGVLWGANSLVGVMNIVSRTADDLEGVEASAGWGSGPAQPNSFKAYAMGGFKMWGDRLKALIHVSYQTYQAPEYWYPFNGSVARYTAPYPQGPIQMTGPMTSQSPQGHMLILSGNAQLGPISAHWHVPMGLPNYYSSNFMGGAVRKDLGEDAIDCTDPANKLACMSRVDPNHVARRFDGVYWPQHAFLRYQGRHLDDKLRIDSRVFFFNMDAFMNRYVSLIPTSTFPSGVVVEQDLGGSRVGGSLDAEATLPWGIRLLAGGEMFYDWFPEIRANFHTSEEMIKARLPYACPEHIAPFEKYEGRNCGIVVIFETNRLTAGGFVDLQKKLLDNLVVEAGARLQGSGGKRALDPVVLLSGGVVWGFMPNWALKLNYAEGYRPPPLHRSDANGEGVNYSGNPNVEVESSRSIQGEINAMVLRGRRAIRQLGFRADYSYTWINNLIQVVNGSFHNAAEVGIHEVELLTELALKKGHRFALGYTFLDIANSDLGKIRTVPNQWLTARVLVNLWNQQLFVSSNLHLRASAEDPNKYPANKSAPANIGDVELDPNGNVVPKAVDTWVAWPTDVVLDRVPPMALWNAGVRFRFKDPQVELAADVYNILGGRLWDSEQQFDPAAYLEITPVPWSPGTSFFLNASYRY